MYYIIGGIGVGLILWAIYRPAPRGRTFKTYEEWRQFEEGWGGED